MGNLRPEQTSRRQHSSLIFSNLFLFRPVNQSTVNAEIEVLEYFELSETLVASHLKEIDSSKATGPDGIPLVLVSLGSVPGDGICSALELIEFYCLHPTWLFNSTHTEYSFPNSSRDES